MKGISMARPPSTPQRPFSNLELRRLEYLLADDTPLYKVPELASHLDAFGIFLGTHRDFIVETGLPPAPFRDSRWLYLKAARLYDTRATWSPWPHAELFSHNPRPEAPPYKWLRLEPVPVGQASPPKSDFRVCEYYEADLLKGLNPVDAERIQQDRPRLFDLKQRIVKRLHQAASDGSASGLPLDCLAMLTDTLLADDVMFLLKMDRFYLDRDVRGEPEYLDNPELVPGGLTDLLEIIGHVVKELSVRTLAVTKSMMPASILEPGFDLNNLHKLALTDTKAVATALDTLKSQFAAEAYFWTNYRKSVQTAIEHDFRVKTDLALLPRNLKLFSPFLKKYIEQLEYLADEGQPLDNPFHPEEKPVWGAGRGELYFKGVLVRRLRVRNDKKLNNVVTVLNVFDEENWPERIDDPLGTDPEKRHDTVKSLNDGLTGIEFFTSGEGFGWHRKED